jgi:hypothetical protein
MESLKIKKDSWHYKLAKFGSFGHIRYYSYDICSYTKDVIKGLLLGFMAFLAILTFIYCIGDALAFLAVISVYGIWFEPGWPAQIILTLIITVGLFLLFFVIYPIVDNIVNLDYNTDKFVPSAYRSFKNKFCIKVEIE